MIRLLILTISFTVALQQLIDVYLFVSSNKDKEIRECLGFKPEEFILAGDSAGGNLSMAALLVLNDINKQIRSLNESNKQTKSDLLNQIIMPKSILNLYAPYNLTLNISPSMILSSCDSMISAGVMLSCFEAYLPLVNFNDNDDNGDHNDGDDEIPKPVQQTTEKNSLFSLSSLTRSISSLISSKEQELEIEAFNGDKLSEENVRDANDWLEFIQTNNVYVQMMDLIHGLIGNFKCKFKIMF